MKTLALACALAGALCTTTAASVPAEAQVPATTPGAWVAVPVGSLAAGHALTREDLEPWLDGVMPYALQMGDVAGAVVVVVKGGQVLLQKGYGYSDVATRTPVSPETTLFRTGSIGKLFTWTAVMQLVEQHRLDLDRDVNAYLDFQIPSAFGRPITLRNLMQHTSGFEDHAKNAFVTAPYTTSIGDFLKHNIPARIFPPGKYPAYSNYGATLAGYIVQRVSGEPYAQYIERHIFAPLDMDHSTMRQPLPLALAHDMSKGYRLGSGAPLPFELLNIAPAGAGSNTGADMARFMLMHLNRGRLGDAVVLQPATVDLMHRQSFQATPPLPGFALGFYHEDRNGHDIIAHEGDTNLFHSDLELLLDDHVGFFISVNSLGRDGAGGTLRNLVFDRFADRYFPAPQGAPEPTSATARRDGALLVGDYQLTRRIQTTLLSFVYLLGQSSIAMDADGTLAVSGIETFGGATKHWREVAPFLWRDTVGHDRMAARVENGMVKAVWFDETVPAFVLQRVPAFNDKRWIIPLLVVSSVVLFVVALSWPVGALIRRSSGRNLVRAPTRAWAACMVGVTAAADLVFVVGMIATLISMAGSALTYDASTDWTYRLFQVFGLVGLFGVLAGAWNLVEVWRDRASTWLARSASVLVAAALVCVAILGVDLHLLTWSLNY